MQKLARSGEPQLLHATGDGWTTRMFAPALGVTEDPATGSAAGPLAVHLARHGRIEFGTEIGIRQGAQVNRPSVLYARADGTPESHPAGARRRPGRRRRAAANTGWREPRARGEAGGMSSESIEAERGGAARPSEE